MSIVAVIPSRYESSRFPGKPLALIKGRPMIRHVYQRVMPAQLVEKVVVATDDSRIVKAVEQFGGEAMMTSPQNRSGTDRAAETAVKLGLGPRDIVVNIQGDQPLVDPRCIDQVVSPLQQTPELEMSTLAFQIVDPREYSDPKDVKVTMDNNGFALYFSRSPIPHDRDNDSLPAAFKHLGVYAYRCDFLQIFSKLPQGRLERIEKLEQLRVLEHGYRIKVVVTGYDSPEVDLPLDIERIESKMA